MTDRDTPLGELRQIVADFVARREWNQFHSPKNIAMSLAIEAAELMEHFQWISMDASREVGQDPIQREAVGDELADVVCYAMAMANELDLDITTSVREKMIKNEKKYPAEEYRGRYGEAR